MPDMPSRVQTDAERRRREAGVEQSMKIRSRSCRSVGLWNGWVSGYVWYLELSREPKHVPQQMRYQNVDLSNGYCLGTIIIACLFVRVLGRVDSEVNLRPLADLLCACAVDTWSHLQYYWADLAQTCSLGPLAMSRILSLRLIHVMHALTSIKQ